MRKINEIIVHCSATPEGRDVTVAQIDACHKQRGFQGIGYHYVITLDGTVHHGRPISHVGAHCLGHNAHSIGVCYIGGVDSRMRPKDTRTPAQRRALLDLLQQLTAQYPGSSIHGHRDFAAKACPSFDATTEYAHLSNASQL